MWIKSYIITLVSVALLFAVFEILMPNTNMKKYISPEMILLALQSEEVMTASEEAFDINVSFDSLWGTSA